jgi:hypothetical protein
LLTLLILSAVLGLKKCAPSRLPKKIVSAVGIMTTVNVMVNNVYLYLADD